MVLRSDGFETSGWTLNMSRGGIRAVVEERLSTGIEYELLVGEGAARKVSLVWAQDQADGQIVGLRYLDIEGSVPPQDG